VEFWEAALTRAITAPQLLLAFPAMKQTVSPAEMSVPDMIRSLVESFRQSRFDGKETVALRNSNLVRQMIKTPARFNASISSCALRS
jgi:hypothetical protein